MSLIHIFLQQIPSYIRKKKLLNHDKLKKKSYKIEKTYFSIKFENYILKRLYIFIDKINEILIIINETIKREIPGFLKISRDSSRVKIEPGSHELISNCNAWSVFIN